MLEDCRIYMAGSMSGLTYEEQTKWRNKVRNVITCGMYDYARKPCFFSPPEFYNFEDKYHESEREVMEYDLNRLRNSDLVVVNFNRPDSIGTAIEIAVAYERRIPVIGLNENGEKLHPWLDESCIRIFTDMKEMCEHIVDYYLN